MNKTSSFNLTLIIIILIGIGFIIWMLYRSPDLLRRNRASLIALKGLVQNHSLLGTAKNELIEFAGLDKNAKWVLGIVQFHLGEVKASEETWDSMNFKSDTEVNMMITIRSQDKDFLIHIVEQYPSNENALFSLAEILKNNEPVEAVNVYSKILVLNPYHNLAGCRLGYIYESLNQYNKAVDSFLQCCENGDSGFHGCNGAGRMMEKLGNTREAIEYYRMSQSKIIQKQADDLENSLRP